ncbi:MAG: hypothetical protein WA890_22255 [Micromonospora sp.]
MATLLSSRPAAWTTPFYLTLDHEPEQGTSAGDPDPATYRSEWQALINALAGHPRRSEVRQTPIFTEYYAKRHSATFWNDFGIVASYAEVDAIGFDTYDTGDSTYRTPTERNAVPLQYARRAEVKKRLILGEWGVDRKTHDTDGSQAAQAMRDNLAYMRQQPDVPYVSSWYQDKRLSRRSAT